MCRDKRYFYLVFLMLVVLIGILLFLNLGERPLFGVEGRWAEAAREMQIRNSWFVPTINFEPHVTKPLIPFWLVKISGSIKGFNETWIRLPGTILGFFTVICFFLFSLKFFNLSFALLSTLFFSTSLGFIQFARLCQSEIYQLFGITLSLTFYAWFREKTSTLGYLGFFTGLLIAALSKGLTALVFTLTFVAIDLSINKRFYHFNLKLILILLLFIFFYFLPYYLTSLELGTELPFYLWFRENLKQVVDPYDNLRPFYIYLYFWPLWVFPYSLLLIFSILYSIKNFKNISSDEKIFLITSLVIFIIFTLVKARRGYYILPILPFSIILITYFIKNHTNHLILKIHKILYLFPIFTIILPLVLFKLNFPISNKILIYSLIIFIFQIFIYLFLKSRCHFLYNLTLICLLTEIFIFSVVQPHYSTSTEKEVGTFVKSLISNSFYKNPCIYSPYGDPVANFYFYAEITEKIKKVSSFEEALKNCSVVIIRKKIEKDWEIKGKNVGFQLVKFEDKKDSSKSYYIFYKPIIPLP